MLRKRTIREIHTQNSLDFNPKRVMFVGTNPAVWLSTNSEALDLLRVVADLSKKRKTVIQKVLGPRIRSGL